jgi:hypothetical protein
MGWFLWLNTSLLHLQCNVVAGTATRFAAFVTIVEELLFKF